MKTATQPPLEKLDMSRGAPMGRTNMYPNDRHKPIKFSIQKVHLDAGGYDSGGAYWGLGGLPLYRAFCPEVQACSAFGGYWEATCNPEIFLRAANREEALTEIRKTLPNANASSQFTLIGNTRDGKPIYWGKKDSDDLTLWVTVGIPKPDGSNYRRVPVSDEIVLGQSLNYSEKKWKQWMADRIATITEHTIRCTWSIR